MRRRGAADDGQPVDILRPSTAGSATPGRIRADFAAAHSAIRDAADPAVVRVHAVLVGPNAVDVVRAPLEDVTLADINGPLSGPSIAAIGARLGPAILELGGALGGAILPVDVGLDEHGWVVLAPLGPHTSAVERSVAGAAAPEMVAGAAPDGRAALFSLGALLYRLATGRVPPTGTAPTPPSTWNHRVSPEVDRAILRLLSSEPSERSLALAELQQVAGPPEDLRPLAGSVVQASAPTAVHRRATAGHPLTLPHAVLLGLEPRALSVAAGLAQVPIAAIDALIKAGLPLVIARTDASDRDRQREEVQRALGVQPTLARPATVPPVAWALAGVVVGAVPAVIGAALLPLLGAFSLVPGIVLGATAVGLGVWRAAVGSGARSAASDAETAWALQERGRAERGQWPQLASVDGRIARLRQDLAHADLPPTADADVRDALKELEHRIEGILAVLQTAERALGAVDRTQLSARLQTLERSANPSSREARDRAARTAADLAEIASRRDGQLALVHEIEGALDDLAGALVQPRHQGVDRELKQVARTAELLRRRGVDQ